MSADRGHIDLAIVRAAIRSDRKSDEGRRNAYEALDRLMAQRDEYKAEAERLRQAGSELARLVRDVWYPFGREAQETKRAALDRWSDTLSQDGQP
jgi:hypothetical protein